MNPTNNSIQMSSQNLNTDMNNINRNKRETPCVPGKRPSTYLTNSEKKNHTVSSIMDSLNQGTANIKYSDDPNIILLLGLSGAGKSTLAQYLFGNNSNLRSVAKKNFNCEATGDFYIEDTGKKIGHNTLLSHTELPDLVIDPETNTTIYDCPGFSDTRDPEYDISGAYFIKAVSDKAKTLKFIFVVNYNSITMGGNREEFITLARHATNLIRNISKYNESIALVATKIKDDKSDDERSTAIADFLDEVRQTLNETNEEPNVQSFIDILLTTGGPDNQDYTRIGLMPKFDTEGRLTDLPAVQAHKKSLLTIIHNNTKFTKIDAVDVKPTISTKSVYYIDDLATEVTQQMWIHIEAVVQKVQVFYNDLMQSMLDAIHSFNDEKIVLNTDQLKTEIFLTKLNTGLRVISDVVRSIRSETTLIEFSKYIISSAMISEVNLSQDLASNISTQHEYLKFLLSVHEAKNSFNVDAKAANGSKLSITNGTDGAPGLPGGPGGNFLGIGATFIDSNDLSISADGGSGGPGQDGGDGMPGQNDTECPPTIKDKNFSNKEHCLSYRLISFGSLYDEGCTANSTYDGFSLNITVKNDWCQVVTCYPKNDWQFKGNGTNGGNGGKGGVGGYAGNITISANVKQSINLSKRVGKTGSDGNGGVGGEARKVGNNLVIDMVRTRFSGMCLPSIQDFSNKHKFVASEKSYFPGNAGTNGLNTENRKDPEKALSPPNFAHQSATDYKTFFRNYSSENPKDVNVKNFLDFF
ncbi:hypothetical protein HCN44_000748 [Aphidius gifuensis]|uniref:G domain-containing protein n=1 Tax=Aphidius gifuensis TaxID=684658 RepID=A0A834XPA9_APHGI|nr:hypothetical protein HCN44_000748 [Aphidius gifuensis]